MLIPSALIEMRETKDVGFNLFNSFPMNLKFKVLVKPKETYKPIPAEHRGDRRIAAALQPLLKRPVNSRGQGCANSTAWVAVHVRQQAMAEVLQFAK